MIEAFLFYICIMITVIFIGVTFIYHQLTQDAFDRKWNNLSR